MMDVWFRWCLMIMMMLVGDGNDDDFDMGVWWL